MNEHNLQKKRLQFFVLRPHNAQATFAGMFPPQKNHIWKHRLNWRPIPIHTLPHKDDYLLASTKQCDHFDYMMLIHMNTTDYTNIFEEYRPFIKHLEIKTGMRLPTLLHLNLLYETLSIEQSKGKR